MNKIEDLLSVEIDSEEITLAEESVPAQAEILSESEYKNNINAQVIDLLKQSLTIHWEQCQALTAQAEHFTRWGYNKIAKRYKEDAEQEHEHATINLKRLEFFDESVPYSANVLPWPRHDMVGIIKYTLDSVNKAAIVERSLIMAARAVGDEITAHMTIPLLEGSEAGIIECQANLKMIDEMGLDNFLTLQV